MNNSEPSALLDARLEKMETRLLRIERRLHLDAPAKVLAEPPATPPPSPPIVAPSSFAPPVIAPSVPMPVPAQTVAEPPVRPTPTPNLQPSTPAKPIATSQAAPSQAATARPTPTAPAPQAKPPAEKSLLDWEQLVGGKWALWAGLLSIFGAIASFLAYTWRFLPPPPPEAKVAMGFFAGVAFLVASEWTRPRAQRWFSEGLAGAGLSICFLSLWAGGAYFSIFSFGFTFGAMAIVCALGVWLAVRADAISLNILSILGGFLTPVLLRGDGGGGASNTAVLLLTYLAVTNAGVLGVALFKRWRASTWLGLGGTVALLLFWSQSADITAMRPLVFAFYSLYFLLYLATACFNSLARREETAPEELGLIIVVTTLYAPLAHDLLRPISGAWPGAFMLGFALFWGALCLLSVRLAPANRTLRDVTGALGLLAFTVAIPIQIAQPWLGIALMGEAAVLAWLARRGASELLRRAGQIVWFVALFPIIAGLIAPAANVQLGLHAGGWPLLFGSAVTAVLAWRAFSETGKADELRDVYAWSAVAGGAWLIGRETLAWGGRLESVEMGLAIYALTITALGLRLRFDSLRDSALLLAAGVVSALALLSWLQPAPALPLWNERFVALILTAIALYATAWLVRGGPSEILRRSRQFGWAMTSLTLFAPLLAPAGNAQFGLHAGGWPWLLALLASAAFAWSAHRETENADELRDVYPFVAVAGGAWLIARETLAWTNQVNFVLIALAIYAVAAFAIGARVRFVSVRLVALTLGAGVAAASVWLAWANSASDLTPFWNARFAAMVLTIGALDAIYQIARATDFPLAEIEKVLARAFPIGAASLLLAAFSTELYLGFAHFDAPQWANRAFFALSIAWNLAALGALSLGLKTRASQWRVWAYGVGGAALASLPVNALANSAVWLPFANWRFGAFAVAVLVTSAAAYLLHRARQNGTISAPETDALGAATAAALGLALFSLTQETWEMGRYLAPAGVDWQRGAQMAISLVWSLFGALLLAAGAQFRVQSARLCALGLLAFTVCKVFLFDLSFLDGASRALSLGGLGLALVFISWLYGRFGRASATN